MRASPESKTVLSSASPGLPVLSVPLTLQQDIRIWRAALESEKAAYADRKACEERLYKAMKEPWRSFCRAEKRVSYSVILDGGDAGTVMMVLGRRFARTDGQNQDELLKFFGSSDFDKYFTMRTELSLNVEKITDEVADRLMQALGDDISEIVTTCSYIVPTERYCDDRVLNERIEAKVAQAEAERLMVPFTPSFKP